MKVIIKFINKIKRKIERNHNINDIRKIKLFYKKKGFKFFDKGNYNLNITIIRNKNIYFNSADDKLYIIFKNNNTEIIKKYSITCDPTLFYRKNYKNKNGVAYIKEGQYFKSYKIGKHKGRDGLIQVGKIKVYRDNNNDNKFDKISSDEGYFGVNIHDIPFKYRF